jgi:hypothetical protein
MVNRSRETTIQPGARDGSPSSNTSPLTLSLEKTESWEDPRQLRQRSDKNCTRPDIVVSPEAPAISPPVGGVPPDGGSRAWLVVVGGFFSMFVSLGWTNCTFPGQAEGRKEHKNWGFFF